MMATDDDAVDDRVSSHFDSLKWQRVIAATQGVELLEIQGTGDGALPTLRWRQDGHTFKAAPRFERGVQRMRIWREEPNRFGDRVTDAAPLAPALSLRAVWATLTRSARILAFAGLVLAVTACARGAGDVTPDAAPRDGGTDDVADARHDAAPDARADAAIDAAIDGAPSGLGLDATCDPTQDECTVGLTCRPTGALRGVCRPIGPLPAGAACQAESDCGYAMTWFSDEVGVARCAVVCDTAAPQARCKPNQPCLALVGRLGICTP